MSSRCELISLLEEILAKTEFYAHERPFFRPPDSIFLNVDGYRKEYERVKSDALWGRRMPVPSDFMRPNPDLDRFPEEHFDRLVAVIGQLLDPYTDPDNHRFIAVLPAPRAYQGNLGNSVEQSSVRKWRDLFGDGFGNLRTMSAAAASVAATRIVKPSKLYTAATAQRVSGHLNVGQGDLEWLAASFPDLSYDPEAGVSECELDVRAAYDSEQGKLHIGRDDATASLDSYLRDSFSIRIELDALDHNGWPTVHEAGGRHALIADRENIDTINLHFYPD